ncbi:MAG: LrgB family protein [Phyllobacterium sp.]
MKNGQESIFELWVYLSASPLLWLTVTIGVFLVAQDLAKRSGFNPLVNPVLISILVLAFILKLTGTDYGVYFDGAQFVHFALGPATVALAVPLYRNRAMIMQNILPIIAALMAGATVAVVSAVGIASLFGAPHEILAAIAPKSVTAGIALGITRQIGGDPALTAVLVTATGVLGSIIVTPLMNLLRIKDYAARGFAAGLTAHGIGTARAFQVNDVAGTFAGLAMALTGLVTAFIAPLVVSLF